MNLRHIDPRSTDWMDAMLEGELERGGQRHAKQQGVDQQVASAPDDREMMSAHAAETGSDKRGLESRPPPSR